METRADVGFSLIEGERKPMTLEERSKGKARGASSNNYDMVLRHSSGNEDLAVGKMMLNTLSCPGKTSITLCRNDEFAVSYQERNSARVIS